MFSLRLSDGTARKSILKSESSKEETILCVNEHILNHHFVVFLSKQVLSRVDELQEYLIFAFLKQKKTVVSPLPITTLHVYVGVCGSRIFLNIVVNYISNIFCKQCLVNYDSSKSYAICTSIPISCVPFLPAIED